MAEARTEPNKRKQFLEERRLVAHGQRLNAVVLGVGGLSALMLGSGTYARWLSPAPAEWATAALAAGIAGSLYFAWQLTREGPAVRVGDAGVAIEKGSEVERLLWCDMERIAVEENTLVLSGTGPTLRVAVLSHALAVSWILKEAAERLPKLIDVPPKFADDLPKPDAKDGAINHVASLQTTGRRCGKSRKVINYERDARLCPTCTQAYLKDEVPEVCVTCKLPLTGRTVVP
jgi:hypothetical protein